MNSHMKHVHSKDKEKKKSASADVGENPDQTTSAANQTEEPAQNMTMLQTYKVILPEEVKEDQKKEYHTLMPRVCELEMATFSHMGQSSRNYIIQDFTNVQSSFYTGTQTGIQIPYDSSVISQIPIPARQIVEMNGDVATRHEYSDQQHPSVQTVNVHYANADHTIQYTNM